MIKVIRNHVITILISMILSCIVWESCYADELPDTDMNTELEDNFVIESESESDQPDSISDPTGQSFNNLYVQNLIVQPPEEVPEEEEEEEIYILTAPHALSSDNVPIIPRDNTLLYYGTFDNRIAWLLLPVSAADQLTTIDGVLTNISSSNITGRLFYEDAFSLTTYENTYFTLISQFSTNLPSTIFSYSFPSYARSYYNNNGRITYADTYGTFQVSQLLPTVDNSRSEKTYDLLFIICLIIGTQYILSFFRLSRR